jgi:hypothetical protein
MRGRPDAATDVQRRSVRRRQLMRPHLHGTHRDKEGDDLSYLRRRCHFQLHQLRFKTDKKSMGTHFMKTERV